ncbi:MAG: glutamate-5-semialdehyde dehydrogenase [Polyangiales bacterium]
MDPDLRSALATARLAQRTLARLGAVARSAGLAAVADAVAARRDEILAANAADLAAATELSDALRDRLALTPARLDGVVAAVREVGDAPDPLAEERFVTTRPNGLKVYRRRIPLGVVAVIYEARPNVTVEAAALTLRSGNAVVLRGGREAARTNAALADAVREGLRTAGLPEACVTFLRDPSRERVAELLGAAGLVDLAIPRGGPALMDFVDQHARVPVVRHGAGVCHLYIDAAADPSMAEAVAYNAKVHRPGVCNAMETLLVHRDALAETLPRIARRWREAGVALRVDPACADVLAAQGIPFTPAAPEDWDREFLSLVAAVRAVGSLDEAIAHIDAHGTQHTASIVTRDAAAAERFLDRVEASCVLWNASTRFNDGGELGLGAEMGISTSRMHAFGPMGARELTAEKFVVRGDGQVRA